MNLNINGLTLIESLDVQVSIVGEVSHEGAHSVSLNLAVVSGIIVVPGLVKVHEHPVVEIFSMQVLLGLQNSNGCLSSKILGEEEFSGWRSVFVSFFHGKVRDHGSSESITVVERLKMSWECSVVVVEVLVLS